MGVARPKPTTISDCTLTFLSCYVYFRALGTSDNDRCKRMSVGRPFKGKLSTRIPPHWPILLRTAKPTPTTSNHTILKKFFFPCCFLVFPSLRPSPILHRHPHKPYAHTHTQPVSTRSRKRRNASDPKRHEESDPASSNFIVLDVSLAMIAVRPKDEMPAIPTENGVCPMYSYREGANLKRTT